jgi:glycosyltransferase involved in cell wall biosynthesis
MTDPFLSVTLTNYNYAPFLPQSVASILSQTYEDFELIIIDNASTDQSADVIRGFASRDQRIRPIMHPENMGVTFSYREAATSARGRYRVHIEADDWITDPKAFERQVTLLEENPSTSFCYSALTMVDSDGRVVQVSHAFDGDAILPGERALEALLSLNFTHTGMMVRQDAYRATEGYQSAFPHTMDTMLAVRLCELGDVGYIDRSMYAFRQHGSNLHRHDESELLEREYLPLIGAAFDGPLGKKLTDPEGVRRRVEQRALVHLPTQHIFRGELGTGWWLYWRSVKAHPYRTLVQRRTLHLVARTILGGRRFDRLRRRLGDKSGGRAEMGRVKV